MNFLREIPLWFVVLMLAGYTFAEVIFCARHEC